MQTGYIDIPEEVTDYWGYIADHLDDIEFEEPELDYDAVEFEVNDIWGRFR
jgi:hypothetical protein